MIITYRPVGTFLVAVVVAILASTGTAQVFFSEDFESLELGPPVDETLPDDNPCDPPCWSPDAPEGWMVDRSNVPDGGVTEWRGWNFVDPIWWNIVAGQDRANFATAEQGFVIAVADGDEWDDLSHDDGLMQTLMTTPSLPVSGGTTEVLSFDNSWRAESPQTARLTATFDGGDPVDVFFWESDPAADNFRDSSPGLNERLEVPINVPDGASEVQFGFEYVGGNNWWWAIDNLEFGDYQEDFEDVELGINVNEDRAIGFPFDPDMVWTRELPEGWSRDDEDFPGFDDDGFGVTEWKGWSFTDKEFWSLVAGDQDRSQFENGEGTVAVADPDEWDDLGNPAASDQYFSFLTTPEIDISGAEAGSLTLDFASSWRDEAFDDGDGTNNQTASIRVSYDGGAFSEVLRWESDPGSDNFKDDAPNESISLALDNPAADTIQLEFGLTQAGNDWWWAIDNLVLSGSGTIGDPGDFNGDGVLDASDIDALTMASAAGDNDLAFDVTDDGVVDSLDVAFWASDLKNTYLGDANLDGEFNSSDLVAVFGAGLYEQGTAAQWSQGDWNGDGVFSSGDLVTAFADGGYEQGPRAAVSAVPEPQGLTLLMFGLLALLRRRR